MNINTKSYLVYRLSISTKLKSYPELLGLSFGFMLISEIPGSLLTLCEFDALKCTESLSLLLPNSFHYIAIQQWWWRNILFRFTVK